MGVDAAFWVDAAWKGGTLLAIAFYVPVTRALDRLNGRADKIDAEHSAVKERLSGLEGDIKALPGDHHIEQLHDKINKVATDLAQQTGQIDGMNALLKVIHHHIMSIK